MLRFFRGGGVAQFVVGGIVSAIIVAFVVEFRAGSGQATAKLKRDCVVRYAGSCVDPKDYFAAFGLIAPRGLEAARAKRLGLRKKALDGMVERELLVEKARALGLGVGEDTINAELEAGRAHVSLPAAEATELSANLGLCRIDRAGRTCEPGTDRMVRQLRVRKTPNDPFDYKLYEKEIRLLANRGPKEFKEMQERELLAERMRQLVRSRVRVSNAEVRAVAERAVVRSATISRDWFAKYTIDTTQETVDRWAFENRAQVDSAWNTEKANWTEGCKLIREVVISMPPMALDTEQSPYRRKAEEARARIQGGESFASVAAALSSGPSALTGGEVGCLSKAYGIGSEELTKAIEKLKVGELSGVIDTPRGFHIVEVLGTLDAAKIEELGKKHVALGLYTHFAADEAAHRFADALIQRVKSGQKLEDAVRELSEETVKARPAPKGKVKVDPTAAALAAADRPRFEISAPFPRSGNPLPSVEPKESLASRAFELAKAETLAEKPFETTTGWVVMQLKELTPPDEAESAQVRATLWQYKADEALSKYVAELRRAAGSKLVIDASFGEDRTRTSDEE
ncbi:MAG: peptidylprolyl isomerase [Myxococcota bacterium]